jgi:hypothetical protein
MSGPTTLSRTAFFPILTSSFERAVRSTFRIPVVAERFQRVLLHGRVLASLSTNRLLEGAAGIPAAPKAFWKMSVQGLQPLHNRVQAFRPDGTFVKAIAQ